MNPASRNPQTPLGRMPLVGAVFACFITVTAHNAAAGGASGGDSAGGGIPGDGDRVIDASLELFTSGVKVVKFVKNPFGYVTKGLLTEFLRDAGLLEGKVPDIPAIEAIAEVVPYGGLIFSAPTAYAPASLEDIE